MIDFSSYGSIIVHPEVSELGLTMQFFPHTRSKLGSMLRLLDDYLNERNIERSILIQSAKKVSYSLRDITWGVQTMTCPFCELDPRLRRSLEMRLHRGEITHTHVETKQGWPVGTVAEHMDMHLDYTHRGSLAH